MEANYQEIILEKKELVQSYGTLLKFKDKQLKAMQEKLEEKDNTPSSASGTETRNMAIANQIDNDDIEFVPSTLTDQFYMDYVIGYISVLHKNDV